MNQDTSIQNTNKKIVDLCIPCMYILSLSKYYFISKVILMRFVKNIFVIYHISICNSSFIHEADIFQGISLHIIWLHIFLYVENNIFKLEFTYNLVICTYIFFNIFFSYFWHIIVIISLYESTAGQRSSPTFCTHSIGCLSIPGYSSKFTYYDRQICFWLTFIIPNLT